jgi:prepilin-type processing-associated H-X9-DG protein
LNVETVTAGAMLAILAALVFVRQWRRPGYFVAYGACVVLLAVLWPAVEQAREAARRSSCHCNLKQIGLAFQSYADIYKAFPPAYIADSKGNRMHSWRVLILPYIEQKPLYDQYDFNEPWNGPHNRLLAKSMPPVYRCPSDDLAKPGETSYAAIDGPGTVFSGNKGSTFGEITDGTSNTIAVIEAAGAGINWMEPRDVPFSSLRGGIMTTTKPCISSRHSDACITAFCDGHTNALHSTISAKTLQALATRAGGEAINEDF